MVTCRLHLRASSDIVLVEGEARNSSSLKSCLDLRVANPSHVYLVQPKSMSMSCRCQCSLLMLRNASRALSFSCCYHSLREPGYVCAVPVPSRCNLAEVTEARQGQCMYVYIYIYIYRYTYLCVCSAYHFGKTLSANKRQVILQGVDSEIHSLGSLTPLSPIMQVLGILLTASQLRALVFLRSWALTVRRLNRFTRRASPAFVLCKHTSLRSSIYRLEAGPAKKAAVKLTCSRIQLDSQPLRKQLPCLGHALHP